MDQLENRIKGVGIRGFVATVQRLKGDAQWQQVLASVPGEVGEALRYGRVIPSGWYPLRWYQWLHQACQSCGLGGRELPRAIGFENTKAELTRGVYKLLLRVVSPQAVVTQASTIFGKYYETGTMQVDDARQGAARVHWSDCADFDRNVWQDVIGGCEGALAAAGATDIVMTVLRGAGDGDTGAEVSAEWR